MHDVLVNPMAKKLLATVAVVGLLVVLIIVGMRAGNGLQYPYGCTHCCLKGLGFALRDYAEEHDGRFPAGAGCPEASLSLLSRGNYGIGAETLCGKTVPIETAERILKRGELLGPESCDWHYVEGLTLADDSRLALVWDKVGLGHSGNTLPEGGHSVWFLGCSEEVISEADWPEFLERQSRLMTARTEAAKKGLPALAAKVRLPTGEIVDHFDASYSLETIGRTGSGCQSGEKLTARSLRWWKLYDGTMVLTLSLKNWKSKPVRVEVSWGKASPDTIVFEMQAEEGR
jgi:hypothetical protein